MLLLLVWVSGRKLEQKIADGGNASCPRAGFSGKVSDSDLAKVQNCIPNAVRGVRARGCGKINKGALSCLHAARGSCGSVVISRT